MATGTLSYPLTIHAVDAIEPATCPDTGSCLPCHDSRHEETCCLAHCEPCAGYCDGDPADPDPRMRSY